MDASNVTEDYSMGLMKALHFITMQSRRKVKQKYTYESFGSAVHARRKMTKQEANQVEALVKELNSLSGESNHRAEQIVKELAELPVKFVPVRRQIKIDYSKTYPYRSKKRGG